MFVNTKMCGYLFGMEDALRSGQSEYPRAGKLNYGYYLCQPPWP